METTRVSFKITGIAPILFDRYHGLPDPKTPDGYKKQAIEKLYRNEQREICIPAVAVKAAMREASAELGKKTEMSRNRRAITAQIFFEKDLFSTGFSEPDGIAEHPVKRGDSRQKKTVVSFRPFLSKWSISGSMIIYGLPINFAQSALELAGFKYGLLGYRPEYGRFVVDYFKEQ